MSNVLEARSLSKSYGELHALRDVSFSAATGELIAVVGPNGAGKTTLLSILAGTQRPSSGAVNLAPRQIGWVPQQSALYSKLSVAENLALFARLEKLTDPDEAVLRMLDQTGLRDRAADAVGELSGGNRQRVNVAIGLLAEPPVLALDEPTASLDPGQRERIWKFVGGLTEKGTTVVFSTHNLGEVGRHATRTLVLAGGRLLFDGTPAELLMTQGQHERGDLEHALVGFLDGASSAEAQRR